jgi:hypothetical protein
MASFIKGVRSGTIDANTVIKMIGNSSEKTMEVGLLSVASKLYLEIAKAARTWLARFLIFTKDNNKFFVLLYRHLSSNTPQMIIKTI